MMEMIKNDITKVISKYMKIDTQIDGYSDYDNRQPRDSNKMPALYANIPDSGS